MHPVQTTSDFQKTILVVDDDPGILGLVEALLGKCDYRILRASDGAEALRKSRDFESEIDLLLSDFQMPGMDGVGLATQLTLERPALKVLLMSGLPGGLGTIHRDWGFLAKPFAATQLRTLIAGLIPPDTPQEGVREQN